MARGRQNLWRPARLRWQHPAMDLTDQRFGQHMALATASDLRGKYVSDDRRGCCPCFAHGETHDEKR